MMEELERMYGHMGLQLITFNDHDSHGKGYAVRHAMLCVTGDLVCFMDADGDIHPKMLFRLLPFIADYDIVVGVKPISGHWSRRLLTFFSRMYLAVAFGVKCDTQTGIKLFRRDAIQPWYSDGWLFDLEILSMAMKRDLRMVEVPVDATPSKKMHFTSIWKTFRESVTLWLELR